MRTPLFWEKREYSGVVGGSGKDRMALAQRRDDKIIEIVERREVADHRLIAAELGLPNTPSSLASIGRRMKRLTDEGFFRLTRQKHVTFAVIPDIPIGSTKERRQLLHRYMQAKFWSCLERVLLITSKKTDRQWRAMGGLKIPDGSFIHNTTAYLAECNVGRDHFEERVLEKSKYYHQDVEYFRSLFSVQDIQVLWISQLHGRAQRMVEEFAHIGEGGMFKVCEDSDIDLFKPESILSDIWISPKDRQKHSLLGDSDVAESA